MRVLPLGILVALCSSLVVAQSQTGPAASATRLTFEVASIKRNVSGDQNSSIRIQPGGQMIVTNNSLFNLIRNAYGTQRYEMVPGPQFPSWIDDKWDILAKAPADAPQAQEQMQLRLRSAPDQPAGGAQPDGVSLFAAIQEQLGLKLEAKRAPVEVLVIDSAERPIED